MLHLSGYQMRNQDFTYVHPTAQAPRLPVDRRLVQALRERFPLKAAAPSDSHAELMFSGGQQSVIAVLEGWLEEQEGEGGVASF